MSSLSGNVLLAHAQGSAWRGVDTIVKNVEQIVKKK